MAILVFGQAGQVARELQILAPVIALGREQADLAIPGVCADAIDLYRPRAVINVAAYTAVDRAEVEEDLARQINGGAPTEMARACATHCIPFVHLSTDYVFDGSGTVAWSPGDHVEPLSAYGRSKLAGEQGVATAGADYVILRTSWIFSAHGQNFVKTMLRLGSERDRLRVVADQIGSPTPAAAVAQACLTIVGQLANNPSKSGTYHFCGTPNTSWANFARAVFAQSNIICDVEDVETVDYPTLARRPLNSRLDCSTTEAAFGLVRPSWKSGLEAVLKELKKKDFY